MVTRRFAAFSILALALMAVPALAQPVPAPAPSPPPTLGTAPVPAQGVRLASKDRRVLLRLPPGWTEQATDSAERVQATDGTHYVLLISENKEDFANIAAYTETVRKQMSGRLSDVETTEVVPVTTAKQPTMRCEIFGTHTSGVRVGFLVSVVETSTRYTQVIAWAARSAYRTDKELLAGLADGLEEVLP